MFKELFVAILTVTLAVDLIFFENLLGSAKDKPPDPSSSTLVAGYDATSDSGQEQAAFASSVPSSSSSFAKPDRPRRLFARSNSQTKRKSRAEPKHHYNLRYPNNDNGDGEQDENDNETNNSHDEAKSQDLMNNNNANINDHDDNNNIDGREPSADWPTQLARPKVAASSKKIQQQQQQHHHRHRPAEALKRNRDSSSDQSPIAQVAARRMRLTIRVKSSKSHVLVSVNGIVIHESKSELVARRAISKQPAGAGKSLSSAAGAGPNDELSPDGRGLHVVVLNERDGSVMSKRVFDTYTPSQDDELAFYLGMISDGRILVLAVKDEASFKMAPSSPARKLLRRLGSKLIGKLRWRDMWAFVARKGQPANDNLTTSGQNLAEGLSKSGRLFDWAQPVILDVDLELASRASDADTRSSCDSNWRRVDAPSDFGRRAQFCAKVEGYGSVCHCSAPAPLSFPSSQLETAGWQLGEVPILVIAGNRPYYLHRMLRSLLQASGVNRSNIIVFIDGFYDEPRQVAELYDLRAIQHSALGRRSGRISHHYKRSLADTFNLIRPEAKFAIIFEEDLDVSRDALIYFNQTLGLLRDDPSLYCVSAWNDQGYEHTAGDLRKLYRVETMPGLGWLLKRDLYKLELEPNWPQAEQAHDWDMWLRTEAVRKKRECIIPDVSRTFHFGSSGTNINSYFQRQYFSKHAFCLRPLSAGDQFDQLDQLGRDAYELALERDIGAAQVVGWPPPQLATGERTNASELLCSLANTSAHRLASSLERIAPGDPMRQQQQINPTNQTTTPTTRGQVIYIKMIEPGDYANWLALASCWHIWDLDARGQHKAMWRVHLDGRPSFVVGVPASPYSKLKPAQVEPFALLAG